MRRLPVLAALCALLAACSTPPEKPAPTEPSGTPPAQAAPSSPPPEPATAQQARIMRDLAATSIYFADNSRSLGSEYQSFLQSVAEFLQATPGVSLTLIGNSDERGAGSHALGLKRGESVKRALVSLGVAEDRIRVLSQGKARPRATCHEERCWAQNRRVDLSFQEDAQKP